MTEEDERIGGLGGNGWSTLGQRRAVHAPNEKKHQELNKTKEPIHRQGCRGTKCGGCS